VPHAWRLDPVNGTRMERLSGDDGAADLDLPADGAWVAWSSFTTRALWRAPLAGGRRGAATRLAETVQLGPRISPDGRAIAFATFDRSGDDAVATLRVIGTGGQTIASLPWELGPFAWHPDGSALLVLRESEGSRNLWLRPLDGGEPRRLTSFAEGFVTVVEMAPEGDVVYLVRGASSSDVVRLRGFR
jgi:hypothetical protein